MKILIGADLVPTDTNASLFAAGDAAALVGEKLQAALADADYRIFNLEVPLADKATPIEKAGPALIAPTAAIAGYTALQVDCLTVSNNHIMDQGAEGFASTLSALDNASIAHVGGGDCLEAAAKPFIAEICGKRVGIYACAENEFSIATEDTPGANPFDALEAPDHVAALKAQCDYVIVLYHGGKEHYRYPSPLLQKTCRKLVEKGADLVLCQHSHCIGCEEKFLHGTIVYGQGNFLFDHSTREHWQTGLLVQLGDDFEVSYIPLRKQDNVVRMAEGEDAETILSQFKARSQEITDPKFLQENYVRFAKTMGQDYLTVLGGSDGKLFRLFNKLMGDKLRKRRNNKRYVKLYRMAIENYVRCEAHRELLITYLKSRR
ncbi:MAG: CapA family protein [Oscillospiraceae bacterium]|nr:CapA family protein [Oscillospiraceae bacterium]